MTELCKVCRRKPIQKAENGSMTCSRDCSAILHTNHSWDAAHEKWLKLNVAFVAYEKFLYPGRAS